MWAEGAVKHDAHDSDGDAAIEVLSFSSVFGSIPLFLSRLANRAGGKIMIATAMVYFEEPPPGDAVL